MGVLCVNNIWLAFTLDRYHFSIVYNYTFAKSIKFKRISQWIKCPTLKDYSAKSLGTFHSDWVLHVPHNNLYCSWWTCKYMCTLHCRAFVCVFVFKVVDMIACIFSIFAMSLYQMNKSSCVCGWVNAWIMCSNKAYIGEKGDEWPLHIKTAVNQENFKSTLIVAENSLKSIEFLAPFHTLTNDRLFQMHTHALAVHAFIWKMQLVNDFVLRVIE